MKNNPNYCIATVTSDGYIQWTMTMLFSFLETNPWFSGDVVVIYDHLSDSSLEQLSILPHLRLENPKPEMLEKLDELCEKLPKFDDRRSRFYSIEIFRLSDYDKILFLDSDMIVVKNIEELFRLKDGFYGCSEWFSGKVRRLSNYESVYPSENDNDIIKIPINTGFMFLTKNMIKDSFYKDLIGMITDEQWANCATVCTDQMIINKYFNQQITLLDTRYNYRPKNSKKILEKEGINFEDASIIHYILDAKPWNLEKALPATVKNIQVLKAYELWYQWYFRFLKINFLQQKVKQLPTD